MMRDKVQRARERVVKSRLAEGGWLGTCKGGASTKMMVSSIAAIAALLATQVVMGERSAAAASSTSHLSDANCPGKDGFDFFCGVPNAEDLVLLPGGRWIVNGQYQPSPAAGQRGPLRLIDTQTRSWRPARPRVVKRQNARALARDATLARASSCSSPPDFNAIAAHGIGLRRPRSGPAMIYVINHDASERIEVFEVHHSNDRPQLNWVGCLETPASLHFNGVAIAPDGTIYATVLLAHGQLSRSLQQGLPVGGVYRLAPGATDFSLLPLSLSGPNGIEISPDGRIVYVSEMGKKRIVAYSTDEFSKPIGVAKLDIFWPDNLHWDANGQLLTAGMDHNKWNPGPADKRCANGIDPDLASAKPCMRSYYVASIDPRTFKTSVIATGEEIPEFSNLSAATIASGWLWIGTYKGDRLALRPIDKNR